mgnify:CR=1 FL=1
MSASLHLAGHGTIGERVVPPGFGSKSHGAEAPGANVAGARNGVTTLVRQVTAAWRFALQRADQFARFLRLLRGGIHVSVSGACTVGARLCNRRGTVDVFPSRHRFSVVLKGYQCRRVLLGRGGIAPRSPGNENLLD